MSVAGQTAIAIHNKNRNKVLYLPSRAYIHQKNPTTLSFSLATFEVFFCDFGHTFNRGIIPTDPNPN